LSGKLTGEFLMAATVHVVTANRLRDGRAVYLDRERRWVETLASARVDETAEALEGELAWAKGDQRAVCDPYVMKAELRDGRVAPVSARERIRAAGPAWIRARFGYQV
jgi:sulfite reductase (NADPH) hemoprotein beta-component